VWNHASFRRRFYCEASWDAPGRAKGFNSQRPALSLPISSGLLPIATNRRRTPMPVGRIGAIEEYPVALPGRRIGQTKAERLRARALNPLIARLWFSSDCSQTARTLSGCNNCRSHANRLDTTKKALAFRKGRITLWQAALHTQRQRHRAQKLRFVLSLRMAQLGAGGKTAGSSPVSRP
jgi:hypothetical protein